MKSFRISWIFGKKPFLSRGTFVLKAESVRDARERFKALYPLCTITAIDSKW